MSNASTISVQRQIPAPVENVFGILSNPQWHTELDGSGFVRSVEHGERLDHIGQKFVMNMTGDHMGGDYQTDNIVSAYVENAAIGWKTAPAGTEPPGWEWLWTLSPDGDDATTAMLTYDWSKVTDQDLLDKVGFPLVTESQLEDSLARLSQASVGA